MSELLPAVTLAVGVVSGFGGQALSSRMTRDRDERTRDAERNAARDAFQRETLLALQDATNLLVDATYRAYIFCLNEFETTEEVGRAGLPSELNNPHRSATLDIVRLRQRVLDDGLRARITNLQKLCMDSVVLGPAFETCTELERRDEIIRAFNEAAKYANTFEDELGRVLRDVL